MYSESKKCISNNGQPLIDTNVTCKSALSLGGYSSLCNLYQKTGNRYEWLKALSYQNYEAFPFYSTNDDPTYIIDSK